MFAEIPSLFDPEDKLVDVVSWELPSFRRPKIILCSAKTGIPEVGIDHDPKDLSPTWNDISEISCPIAGRITHIKKTSTGPICINPCEVVTGKLSLTDESAPTPTYLHIS